MATVPRSPDGDRPASDGTATAPAEDQVAFGTPAGRWVLAGMVLGSGMAMLDATVVNVALPSLGEDLGADFTGLQWVVTGYTLTLASLILIGGSLGDRLGRRRVFTGGMLWFVAASVLCGVAPSLEILVGARLLQGMGGALLTPGSLAILQASFRSQDRARAIGAWSGLAGITTAVGPFVGGWLVEVGSWRYIFLLNVPLGALVGYIAVRHVPESRDPTTAGPLDYTGSVLGALGLAASTYGLIAESLPVFAAGLAALVVFLVAEAKLRHPMLPLTLFRSRQFSAANGVTFALYAALGMILFLLAIVLQRALEYSALATGAALFPITLIMLVFSAGAGALAQRIGPRIPMAVGPLVVAAGLALMVRITPGGAYVADVLPALVVFGAGLVITVAPLTATALAAVDSSHAGIASGVNNAIARVGGLLAVAAVPLLAGFDPAQRVAPGVLVDGFHRASLAAAALAVLAGGLAFAFIRADVLEEEGAEPAPEPERPAAEPCFHCGVGAPPPVTEGAPATAARH